LLTLCLVPPGLCVLGQEPPVLAACSWPAGSSRRWAVQCRPAGLCAPPGLRPRPGPRVGWPAWPSEPRAPPPAAAPAVAAHGAGERSVSRTSLAGLLTSTRTLCQNREKRRRMNKNNSGSRNSNSSPKPQRNETE